MHYAAGTPNWVDLSTSDLEAAKRFYGELFGWQPESDPEMGGYTLMRSGGRMVAGAMTLMEPGQPVAWSTYFATDDADAATEQIEAAGGAVVAAPMQVGDQGRMAFYTDPSGSGFGVWQAGKHPGFEACNEPSAYCWTELATPDPQRAREFYPKVFGWSPRENEMPGGTYVEFHVGDAAVAGMIDTEEARRMPPGWLVHFMTADVDATEAQAKRLGAAVVVPAADFPGGRFAILADPQGAGFGVVRMDDQPA